MSPIAPAGIPQRIVSPWMEEMGFTLETPMEEMVAVSPISEYGWSGPPEIPSYIPPTPKAPFVPTNHVIAGGDELTTQQVIAISTLASGVPTNGVVGAMPTHADIMPMELGVTVNGVPISGPGVPEPPKGMIAKAWHVKFQSEKYGTFQMFYWRLIDGRCMSYHSPTKTWKIWRPKKHIVISKDPRVSNLRKLGRLNKRVEKMLRPFQPKVRGFPAKALAKRYLSSAERKLLTAGGS